MNTRQIHIFFRFSKVIRQFVWLFPCFVRVLNPCCVNLKLFKKFAADVSGVSLKVSCKILNNFRFTQHGFTTLTKHRNKHCCALEILKKIWTCLTFIYLYLFKSFGKSSVLYVLDQFWKICFRSCIIEHTLGLKTAGDNGVYWTLILVQQTFFLQSSKSVIWYRL